MSYNKKAHLQTNIEAIRIAFELDREKRRATEEERAILQQYSGFGGIKCILNPAQTEADKAYWTKSESDLFPMVADLHKLIRENSKDEQEYRRYFGSLKSSVLTANIYDLCLYPGRKNIQEIISISQEMKTVSHVMKPVT
jgi:hypothetical protein